MTNMVSSPEALGCVQTEEVPSLYYATLPTYNGPVTVYELWKRFDESPYGLHMDTQPLRFAQDFAYDRESMVRDLGKDVLPRYHQYETGVYAAETLGAERDAQTLFGQIPDEEAAKLLFACALHDMGETTEPSVKERVGATVGDIKFGRKTAQDRVIEAAVRRLLFDELYADVSPEVIVGAEAIISHEDTTLSHEIFEMAHNLQAYMTGARARVAFETTLRHMLDYANPDIRSVNLPPARKLGRMHQEVLLAMQARVTESAKQFIFAKRVQHVAAGMISTASESLDISFEGYRRSVDR